MVEVSNVISELCSHLKYCNITHDNVVFKDCLLLFNMNPEKAFPWSKSTITKKLEI